MINLKEKLENKDFLDKTRQSVDYFLSFDEIDQAFHLYQMLDKMLAKIKEDGQNISPTLQQYDYFLIVLRAVALPQLSPAEVSDLLKNNFLKIIQLNDYLLKDKFKVFLVSNFVYPEDRDKFKNELKKILLENKEKISDLSFKKNDGQTVSLTICSLLADYNTTLGLERTIEIKKAEYFSQKFSSLPEKDRETIKKILDFYEFLKLSSMTPEGYEIPISIIDNGKRYILRDGRLETIDPKIVEMVETYYPILQKELNEFYSSKNNDHNDKDILKKLKSFEEKYIEDTKDNNIENSK